MVNEPDEMNQSEKKVRRRLLLTKKKKRKKTTQSGRGKKQAENKSECLTLFKKFKINDGWSILSILTRER